MSSLEAIPMSPTQRGDSAAARRLCDLVPDDTAHEVVEAVLAQLDVLALHLFPPARMSDLRGVGRSSRDQERRREYALQTELGQAVRDLTRFAQTGEGEIGGVPGAIHSVFEAVCTSAIDVDRTREVVDRIDTSDLGSPVGPVLVAALARYRVELGEDVSVRELAALTGLPEAEVQLQAELAGLWVSVTAAEARRWLRKRGVPGLGPK